MDSIAPPELVRQPDGSTEPFEAERIARQLFAAIEHLGKKKKGKSFLAHELVESIVHFLALDCDGQPVTAEQIEALVVKVVRELGHPAIAKAYAERKARVAVSPATNRPAQQDALKAEKAFQKILQDGSPEALTKLSLTEIYPRDLVSAHREGLILLVGLDTPREMGGLCLNPSDESLTSRIHELRDFAGQCLAVDSPEYELAESNSRETFEYLAELMTAVMGAKIDPVLNLSCALPPTGMGSSPLFDQPSSNDELRNKRIEEFLRLAECPVYFHLSDLKSPLLNLAVERAFTGGPIEFVFDRPKQPIVLGPGIDRKNNAVMCTVGVDLTLLYQQMGNNSVKPDLFLKKVASLARFAKTAAHVKQDFLRKHGRPGIKDAFLLDRAQFVIVPLGLMQVANWIGSPASEFGVEILQAIRSALENDRPRHMNCRVDPQWSEDQLMYGTGFDAFMKESVRTASTWHKASNGGCVIIPCMKPKEALEVLRRACNGDVSRINFATPSRDGE